MTTNPTGGGSNQPNQDDPFLIQEDARVFDILIPSSKGKISKFEEVSGLISYSQYALLKYQFVAKYQQDQGQPPPEDHIRSIIRSFGDLNSAALLSLKQQSERLLEDYAKEYLENSKREEILEPIEKIVKKHTNFWSSIWANLVAAVLYSFVVAVIIFTATAAIPNNKFSQIIRILLEEESVPSNPTPSLQPSTQSNQSK
ncbi:MAG: hypothetical protein MUF49_24435 [Oculatellaceae cyanobacterium Prado106]|jgi:hypothetical protein|nr:hypothetical protein [Oculatellaceae cyanobacterium Prado106]